MTTCPRCGKENPAEIHTCTPLALRLADALDKAPYACGCTNDASEELRRLHSVSAELLDALKLASVMLKTGSPEYDERDAIEVIDAAIARATGEQT